MEEDEKGNKPDDKKRVIPESARDYSPVENLIKVFLILVALSLIIAGITLICMNGYSEKNLAIPGGCCFGGGLVTVWAFFLCIFIVQRRALNGKVIIGRKGTRHIEVTVIRCVEETTYSSAVRTSDGVKQTAYAVYKTVLFAEGRYYKTRCKTFYYPRESVTAYVNGRRAYIDENEPCNKREIINKSEEEQYD